MPNSFYERSIPLTLKTNKTVKRNILNRILANRINNISDELHTTAKWGLFQMCDSCKLEF